VGAVSHYLERDGIATTGISLVREQTEAMRLPRFLWVPFELGRPFGAPGEPDFQRRVLVAALQLLERTDGPVVLEDFPDDAPASDVEPVLACPVTFAPKPSDDLELVQETRREIARLAPWVDGAPSSPPANSGVGIVEIPAFLGRLADGEPVDDALDGRPLVEVTRLACDDARALYLLAARRQPGQSATTAQLDTWFWRQTALGQLIGAVAHRLSEDPDPAVRGFAGRALVPRGHQEIVRPSRPPEEGRDDHTDA
jgi:hypothetical protein